MYDVYAFIKLIMARSAKKKLACAVVIAVLLAGDDDVREIESSGQENGYRKGKARVPSTSFCKNCVY